MAKNWRNSKEYNEWRSAVLKNNPKCDICLSDKGLHAHHINHASYFPELRFEVKNGITLCNKCHSNYHNNYHRSYRHKCTEYDYKNFKSLVKYLITI